MTRKELWVPYSFLAPVIILLVVFRLIPAVSGLRESLMANPLGIVGKPAEFTLNNFERLFSDPTFWKSLKVTVLFNLIVNPVQIGLALALSVLASKQIRGIRAARSIYLVPVAISFAVTALVWGVMLDLNSGLVNGVLAHFGIPRQPFLVSVSHARWSVGAVITWKAVPYWMIFLLAGLQGIPKSLVEAAAIDGASSFQFFTRVTLPLLRRVIVFVLVADTVGNFILFEPIYLLTRGGPELSTNLLMFDAYRRGFVYGDISMSAAMVVVLLAMVTIFVLAEFFFLGRDERS